MLHDFEGLLQVEPSKRVVVPPEILEPDQT
jgi:hypothetical protein